ncbi:MAG TPA: Na+-transporting NADH:ubiquinone oxidoreductase subunit D [Clostridiales bacterium]|nr:RnfABCDGE type electron transport complex subunit D [Clostridia bacterium]HCS72776.1 Na+-transporting NADH:ubiquinone oxidoreductase subunit D [Clostridiales bacterium]
MNLFTVSSSPHIKTRDTTSKIMLDVIIALIPAGLVSIWLHGVGVLWIVLLAVVSAVLTEYVVQKFMKKPVTISDLSAVVTGLLLAYNLPPGTPWWMVMVGSVIAIALVKQVFGGIGHNFMNPALAARAILLASWPAHMTRWIQPGTDAVTSATPLALANLADATGSATSGATVVMDLPSFQDVFMGNIPGTIGEVSSAALLLGAAYLLLRGVINWRIPITYMAATYVCTMIFGGVGFYDAFYQLFLGGLILGAFFMATDYSSSPVTPLGQVIMGFGCGILTAVIRIYGGYPEGVTYSILLMNVATPLIDKYTQPKIYGEVRKDD